jgi:hypothetical protein
VVRAACLKSAVTGVASGVVTTGATIAAAESPGPVGLLIAIPVAAIGVTAEMVARVLIHLDMTCDLAAIFGVRFDPDNPSDFWQLYSLAFEAHAPASDEDDPGRELVQHVEAVEAHAIGATIGHQLVGESVLKNIVPFLGIATSSATNWRMTRRLGDTVRRYLRYRRALGDAMAVAEETCRDHLDLLIEGLWFLFVADGKLVPEEATMLATLLGRLDPVLRRSVEERFIDDESDWLGRLPILAEDERDAFLYALEVAAAVDKAASLPEQKILGRAAKRLGRALDMQRVDRMIREFETVGVLQPPRR